MSNKGKLRNFGVYCEILELRFSELIVQSSPVLASPWVTQVQVNIQTAETGCLFIICSDYPSLYQEDKKK